MAKTDMNEIIKVEKLVKKYDGKKVVKGISFSVKEGEIFGILGPNGAGKSTTLEMIETLRPIDGGKATLDGFDVKKRPQKSQTNYWHSAPKYSFHGEVEFARAA